MGKNLGKIDPLVIDAIREVVMLVRHFVNHPEDVQVDIESNGYSALVALRTHPKDVGQVIGRNAHLVNSIRSFLSAIQGKNKIQIIMDYVTDEDKRREYEKGNYLKRMG
jgi:predicted RNA-binding protein YlqC (UPF0109 family)